MTETKPSLEAKRKERYFESRAETFPGVVPIFKAGKIWGKGNEDWKNVAEHCLAQGVAAEILAEALGLQESDSQTLIRTLVVSDWDKRIMKKPNDFTPEEIEVGRKQFEEYGPDYELLVATDPVFYVEAYIKGEENLPFLQLLTNYIDNIADGSNFVTPEARIRALEKSGRWPKLREDFDHQLGGQNVYDYMIKLNNSFAELLLARLNERFVAQGKQTLGAINDIPTWLNRELDERMRAVGV